MSNATQLADDPNGPSNEKYTKVEKVEIDYQQMSKGTKSNTVGDTAFLEMLLILEIDCIWLYISLMICLYCLQHRFH